MITSTFSFIPGIGEKTEKLLWRRGILTWNDLKAGERLFAPNRTREKVREDYLRKAQDSLKRGSCSFFAQLLPQRDHWRLYKDFENRTVFLDIETTGLSLYYDVVTLVGTFDGRRYRVFVKDNNLTDLVQHLRQYEIVVTFNGKLFDVPFIKKLFPKVRIPPVHIDLRFLLQSLGFTGPLKETERKLSIQREPEVQKINGRGAAVLWSKFLKGDNDSLRRLVLYNMCDTGNLKTILDFCYRRKIERDILPFMKTRGSLAPVLRVGSKKGLDFYGSSFHFTVPSVTIHASRGGLAVRGDNKRLLIVRRDDIRRTELKINTLIRRIKREGRKPLVVGIDLTGCEKRASGFCILRGKEAHLSRLETDHEIVSRAIDASPDLISIDSPLSLPKGRCCAEDSCECRVHGIMRECERQLKRRGINVYPCLIPSMQRLTMRGIRLRKRFRRRKYEVIESYPGAAQDILRFPRKRINLRELEIDLMNMGIKPMAERETITHDEIDALTSALVGYFYLAGMYDAVGNYGEGFLIIPDVNGSEVSHGKR